MFIKFQILSHRQVVDLFDGRIRSSSIYGCLRKLADAGHITSFREREIGETLYLVKRRAYEGVLDEKLIPPIGLRLNELNHRLRCVDVFMALAKREYVTGIVLEHELGYFQETCRVFKRRPDGFFIVEYPDLTKAFACAIEVETTLRNQSRVEEVIQTYQNSCSDWKHPLDAVFIFAGNEPIANAYRKHIGHDTYAYKNQIILSEGLGAHDMSEGRLGKTLARFSDHPSSPLEKICTDCSPSPTYLSLSKFARIQYPHMGFRTPTESEASA